MGLFSKKQTELPKDDSFQMERSRNLTLNQHIFPSPLGGEGLGVRLRGKIGLEPGVVPQETIKSDIKSDTINLEPETEYAQVMRINIDQKLDE